MTFAAPEARLGAGDDEAANPTAAEIFAWHERRRESAAVRRLAALGVRVVSISADSAATLLSRPLAAPRTRVA